jgi:hypothetical protein
MHIETSDLHTRWIDGDGAEAIMASAGITPDEFPLFNLSMAKQDREEYVRELLFTIAYAVGERSANPVAFVEGGEEEAFYSYGERRIKAWAKRNARALEKLLEEL